MKIIDVHSHILPGMDDGSSSEAESLRMLKMAARQGVTGVIATPHYSPEYSNRSPYEIRLACKQLEQKAREKIHLIFRFIPDRKFYTTRKFQKNYRRRSAYLSRFKIRSGRIYAMGSLFRDAKMCQNFDTVSL